MKTKLTVMASAILMGTAFTALAADPPSIPAPYPNGPLAASTNPGLFQSEKAAFAALEGAMQEAEAFIYQGGCASAVGRWDISAFADPGGYGGVDVSSNGSPDFALNVAPGAALTPSFLGGTRFLVTTNPGNSLKAYDLPAFTARAYYSKGGAMMVEDATFTVRNVNTGLDSLSGTVIKDFYKYNPTSANKLAVPTIYDWGLQSVSKNLVPQDKWWQRSIANRSDNGDGYTIFQKDRLYSAKNGGKCRIIIQMGGLNDADGFDQSGLLVIQKP